MKDTELRGIERLPAYWLFKNGAQPYRMPIRLSVGSHTIDGSANIQLETKGVMIVD